MLNDSRRGQHTDKTAVPPGAILRAIILGLLLAAAIGAVLLVDFLPSNQVILEAGEISPVDILAPYELTYQSEIRTRQEQDAQAAAVQEVYDRPDVTVARQQELLARQIFDYLTTIREDPYATQLQQIAWIDAVDDVDLTPEVITTALALDDQGWLAVRDETIRVLELAMQGEIREGGEARVRRTLPTFISGTLTDREARVVEAIAGSLVKANTFYNAARTEEARQQARASTEPVMVTVQKGEAIVRAGSRVTALNIEALDVYGLRQQAVRWQSILSALLLAVISTLVFEMFVFRLYPAMWARWRTPVITFSLLALFVLLGKLMLPFGDTVIPYLYPLPALSMLLTILFGPALGMAAGVVLALLGAYIAGGSLDLTLYLILGTLVGSLALGKGDRLKSFLWAGLAVALANATVIFITGLLATETDLLWTSVNALVGIVMGGLAASLTLAAFLGLSTLLDVVTPFQLMELARPTHPLFRQLLLNAPGTYHHTILVSNMAEEAAERIGADSLLTRVGTYYHDIGKTARPYFFTENRAGSVNPHDRLDPHTSAQIILSHVHDGLDLAEKYHLPAAVRAFIPEHHGTGITLAFYRMAVSQAGDGGNSVDRDDFRYPGPKPQSRETAIAMLADSSEARVRSAEPKSVEEMDRIIAEAIKSRLDEGQLDESDLTLHDLTEIRAAFLNVLKGVFHPRIKYPEPVKVRGPRGEEVEV